jgi:single-stranded-DNA-specific exonuclease
VTGVLDAGPVAPARRKQWELRPAPSAADVGALETLLTLPTGLCQLLVVRGLSDPEAAKAWLRPALEHLRPPETLPGMADAVARLDRAIAQRERILVHGDYDVDGICATTLLVSVLRELGGEAEPFIPHRLTDGYDLGAAGVSAAQRLGATLVLTCDCGTSALEPIAALHASGIDVIVSDHHLPGGPLPACVAVLSPKHPDARDADPDLVAVGVAFQLARALYRARQLPESRAHRHLDLVALATVADVGALRGDNRILVRHGLKRMAAKARVGLDALLRSSGLADKPLSAGRLAFTLAPRLNAAGRIDAAMRGVELLLEPEAERAREGAEALERLNERRQELDRSTLAEARAQAAQRVDAGAMGLVLHGPWHAGVVGIVASRIVEEFGRPAVLVAMDGATGKGSGRSIGSFDLHHALGECRDLLLRFGGHRAAAGVTVAEGQLEAFAERFDAVARARLTADDLVPVLKADLELPLSAITRDMAHYLQYGEPWGVANPTPVFVTRGVALRGAPRVLKGEHLKLTVDDGASGLDAIGFRLGGLASVVAQAHAVDLAYQVELDHWNGRERVQLKLVDVRPSA